jgi:hypothetical protein
MGLDPLTDSFDGGLEMGSIVAEHGTADQRLRPFIVQVHLRGGDVELTVKPRQQRLEPSALFFQRSAAGEVEVEGKESDHRTNTNLRISNNDLQCFHI